MERQTKKGLKEFGFLPDNKDRMHDLSIEIAGIKNIWMQFKDTPFLADKEDRKALLCKYKQSVREMAKLISENTK